MLTTTIYVCDYYPFLSRVGTNNPVTEKTIFIHRS